jgi:hypothetical protein
MFIKGDELILLRELPDCVLASCEGVVGWVKLGEVEFDHVAGSSASVTDHTNNLPRTILTEPSPPPTTAMLPTTSPDPIAGRVSGPFELESPQPSPSIDQTEFQLGQAPRALSGKSSAEENRESIASIASSEVLGGIGGFMMDPAMDVGDRYDPETEELKGGFQVGVDPDDRCLAFTRRPDARPTKDRLAPPPAALGSALDTDDASRH